MVYANRTNQLEYLDVCGYVRKIFSNFDFNDNDYLDKEELKSLLDAFMEEIVTGDPNADVD